MLTLRAMVIIGILLDSSGAGDWNALPSGASTEFEFRRCLCGALEGPRAFCVPVRERLF